MNTTETGAEDKKGKSLSRRIRRWILVSALVFVVPPGGYYLYQRVVRTNFGVVGEGLVYRSARPDAGQMTRWAKEHGIRTLINLRGVQTEQFYADNRAAARQAGVKMIDIRLSSRRLPKRDELRRLIEVLETAERPILIHCRDGSDRTGLASVIASMAVCGNDFATARNQMSIRYFHLQRSPDRIGGVLNRYEQYCRGHNLDTDG